MNQSNLHLVSDSTPQTGVAAFLSAYAQATDGQQAPDWEALAGKVRPEKVATLLREIISASEDPLSDTRCVAPAKALIRVHQKTLPTSPGWPQQ